MLFRSLLSFCMVICRTYVMLWVLGGTVAVGCFGVVRAGVMPEAWGWQLESETHLLCSASAAGTARTVLTDGQTRPSDGHLVLRSYDLRGRATVALEDRSIVADDALTRATSDGLVVAANGARGSSVASYSRSGARRWMRKVHGTGRLGTFLGALETDADGSAYVAGVSDGDALMLDAAPATTAPGQLYTFVLALSREGQLRFAHAWAASTSHLPTMALGTRGQLALAVSDEDRAGRTVTRLLLLDEAGRVRAQRELPCTADVQVALGPDGVLASGELGCRADLGGGTVGPLDGTGATQVFVASYTATAVHRWSTVLVRQNGAKCTGIAVGPRGEAVALVLSPEPVTMCDQPLTFRDAGASQAAAVALLSDDGVCEIATLVAADAVTGSVEVLPDGKLSVAVESRQPIQMLVPGMVRAVVPRVTPQRREWSDCVGVEPGACDSRPYVCNVTVAPLDSILGSAIPKGRNRR